MRIDELKDSMNAVPEPVIQFQERKSELKRITANHTSLPVKEGNSYPLLSEGRDYYNIKLNGKSIYVQKWIFDLPPKRKPRWESDDEED